MARGDVKVVKTRSGNSPEVISKVMKTGETFKVGEFVRLTTGNTVAVMAADNTTGVYGVAAEDATTTPTGSTSKAAGTSVAIWPLNHDTIFSAPIASGALAATEYNTPVELAIVTGTHGVAADAFTNTKAVEILEVDPTATTTRVHICGLAGIDGTSGSQYLGTAGGSAARAA